MSTKLSKALPQLGSGSFIHSPDEPDAAVSRIAHDFKNILTSIQLNVFLARAHANQEEDISRILTQIEKAALRGRDVVQQFLIVSSQGALKKAEKEIVSLSKLLKDTRESTLNGLNSKCECAIQDDLWLVSINETEICAVIRNLITNAAEAMDASGTIKVGAENVIVERSDIFPMKRGKYVKISVQDRGMGIMKENLRKIFDPYFTTKKQGNGLGLAISHAIIKDHDGYIDVESEVGLGTTFHIYLPALLEERGVPL
ncbi:MAG: hypothetical protein HXS52_12730 [Theionarchaea archaeon]|nr:hypothetical protein [Theionarchaea archaeon]